MFPCFHRSSSTGEEMGSRPESVSKDNYCFFRLVSFVLLYWSVV